MKMFAFAAVLVGVAIPAAQIMRYTPGKTRYEQSFVITTPQNLFGSGAGMEIRNRAIMSVNVTPLGRDSLSLEVVVDSSTTSSTGLNLQSSLVAPGTVIRRRMSMSGKSAAGATEARSAADVITGVLPALPANARTGSTWEDTLPLSMLGGADMLQGVTGQIVRSLAVSKDTTYEGESGWLIRTGSTIQVRSASSSGNMQISIDGSGGGNGIIIFAKTGVLLYSSETDNITLNVRLGNAAAGAALETSTTRTTRRLK
jgi:hypothetical protein